MLQELSLVLYLGDNMNVITWVDIHGKPLRNPFARHMLRVLRLMQAESKWAMIANLFKGTRTTQAVRNRANRLGVAPKGPRPKKA